MLLNCISVGAGGFVGAVLRYLVSLVPFLHKGSMPYQTLLVNVLGAVLIGFIIGISEKNEVVGEKAMLFLKVGVCGGFTTFSTFAVESLGLFQCGKNLLFGLYIVLSVALCIGGVVLGKVLAGE